MVFQGLKMEEASMASRSLGLMIYLPILLELDGSRAGLWQ